MDQRKIEILSKSEYLIKINDLLDISPNELLGIQERKEKKFIAHIVVGSEKEMRMIEEVEGPHWKERFSPIPIAKDPISAGNPVTVREDPDGVAIIYKEWTRNEENFTAVRVQGQSMEPTIEDGSLVGIDHSQKDPKELHGKIVALKDPTDKDRCTIKRLHVISKSLMVGFPDNIEQKDKTVVYYGDEVDNAIIGKVVWWWGKQE